MYLTYPVTCVLNLHPRLHRFPRGQEGRAAGPENQLSAWRLSFGLSDHNAAE